MNTVAICSAQKGWSAMLTCICDQTRLNDHHCGAYVDTLKGLALHFVDHAF